MNSTTPPPDSAETRGGEFPVGPEVPPALRRGLERLAVPEPRTLLTWIVVVRLLLVAIVTLGRSFDSTNGGTADLPGKWIAVLAVAAFAASIWLAWRLRRSTSEPGPNVLVVQAVVDILVVTALVVSTNRLSSGEAATAVAAVYVALVTVYALLLPVARGLLVVLLTMAAYIAITIIPLPADPPIPLNPPDELFWGQVGVIVFVGVLVSVLGNRLTGASQERRVLADALAQARLEADQILATIQSGVITVESDGRLGYLNPRGRLILSAANAAFMPGQPVLEALRASSRELHDAIIRGLTDGTRVSRGEAAVRRADGTLFPVGLSTTTFTRPGTDRRLVTAIFTDISDLKRLQEFRLRAERLEAVASLSASLAHEIRNPLAAMRSAVEQLARSGSQDEDDQTLWRLIMRESERLNRLLSEFLDFSRVRASHFEKLDLLTIVNDAARMTGSNPDAFGAKIVVHGTSTEFEADEDLVHRMVSNLLLNAAQALQGRGTITVTVGRTQPGEGPSGSIDRPIKLFVQDDGPGIPEAVRERLFEPFVTGRPGGTGLGLAIVQRAVSAHRGVILVDTAAGVGTTFSIFLPMTWNREDEA